MSKPERPDMLTRVHIAEPAPLGLFGLAGGCLLLFCVDFEGTEGGYLQIPWIFFLPGMLQLIAGCVDFLRHNVFGATAFIGYSMFWFGLATTIIMEQKSSAAVRPDPARQHVGVMAIAYMGFSIVLTLVSLGLNKVFFGILFFIDWAFLFLALHIFEDLDPKWLGASLVGVFICSFYGFIAILLLKIASGEILPIGAPIVNLANYLRDRELKDEVAAAAVEEEPIAVVIGPDGKPVIDPNRSGHMHRFNPNSMANTNKGRHVINERLLSGRSGHGSRMGASGMQAHAHPHMMPHSHEPEPEPATSGGAGLSSSRAKLKGYDEVANTEHEIEMAKDV